MTLSNLANFLRDFYDGVVGIVRKRARYRCAKRGQDWDEYEKPIRDSQRIIGQEKTKELMSAFAFSKNPFLEMVKGDEFPGKYIPVPLVYGKIAKRKRSGYRNAR